MKVILLLLSVVFFLGAAALLFMSGELLWQFMPLNSMDNPGFFIAAMFFVPGICLLGLSVLLFKSAKSSDR